MKEIRITALEMPGNIQKPFYDLQSELLYRYKIPAARLFPPIVPLFPGKLSQAAVAELQKRFEQTETFTAETSVLHNGEIYFSPLGTIPPWPAKNFSGPSARTGGVFSLFSHHMPAIVLAPGGGHPAAIPRGHQLRWKKMYIAEIRIRFREEAPWWREVYWEYTKYLTPLH
jgi:hypothetical protein